MGCAPSLHPLPCQSLWGPLASLSFSFPLLASEHPRRGVGPAFFQLGPGVQAAATEQGSHCVTHKPVSAGGCHSLQPLSLYSEAQEVKITHGWPCWGRPAYFGGGVLPPIGPPLPSPGRCGSGRTCPEPAFAELSCIKPDCFPKALCELGG